MATLTAEKPAAPSSPSVNNAQSTNEFKLNFDKDYTCEACKTAFPLPSLLKMHSLLEHTLTTAVDTSNEQAVNVLLQHACTAATANTNTNDGRSAKPTASQRPPPQPTISQSTTALVSNSPSNSSSSSTPVQQNAGSLWSEQIHNANAPYHPGYYPAAATDYQYYNYYGGSGGYGYWPPQLPIPVTGNQRHCEHGPLNECAKAKSNMCIYNERCHFAHPLCPRNAMQDCSLACGFDHTWRPRKCAACKKKPN